MPKTITSVTIFVGSPQDVKDERESLNIIVRELNSIWSGDKGIMLNVLQWEKDIAPGFSDYPQQVINNQIPDDYDIFIGIFWTRIGTATPKSDSGTVEELDRALERYEKDPESVDIKVYFKDEPIAPSKLDPVQINKLLKLKGRISKKGGIYWPFLSTEDFENDLRNHLSKVIQKWANKDDEIATDTYYIDKPNKEDSREKDSNDSDQHDDFGLLDYLDSYEDSMHKMTDSLKNIGEATTEVGTNINKSTENITTLTNAESGANALEIRKAIKEASKYISSYAKKIDKETNILKNHRKIAFGSISKGLSILASDFGESDLQDLIELKQVLTGTIDSALESQNGLSSFSNTIAGLPKLTIDINKSKRQASSALNNLNTEIDSIMHSANNTVTLIDTIIESH